MKKREWITDPNLPIENKKTEAKHTQGPWRVCNGTTELPLTICGQDHTTVGAVTFRTMDNGTVGANAHLIAAAPELLEALKGMIQYSAKYSVMSQTAKGSEVLRKARAAIAKARGEA